MSSSTTSSVYGSETSKSSPNASLDSTPYSSPGSSRSSSRSRGDNFQSTTASTMSVVKDSRRMARERRKRDVKIVMESLRDTGLERDTSSDDQKTREQTFHASTGKTVKITQPERSIEGKQEAGSSQDFITIVPSSRNREEKHTSKTSKPSQAKESELSGQLTRHHERSGQEIRDTIRSSRK